jgi:hypothetical protein
MEGFFLIWCDFLVMFVLSDYPILWLLHGWMHSSSWAFTHLHKDHHSVKRPSQALLAFRFTGIDLLIQNSLAPILLLLIKAMIGADVRFNLASRALLGVQQIEQHSCNPHTVFFNPVLKRFLKVTIVQSLHHVPWSHNHPYDDGTFVTFKNVFAAERQRAEREYEKVFEVNLGYATELND